MFEWEQAVWLIRLDGNWSGLILVTCFRVSAPKYQINPQPSFHFDFYLPSEGNWLPKTIFNQRWWFICLGGSLFGSLFGLAWAKRLRVTWLNLWMRMKHVRNACNMNQKCEIDLFRRSSWRLEIIVCYGTEHVKHRVFKCSKWAAESTDMHCKCFCNFHI